MMWLYLVLVAGMVLCGIQAARARRLIVSVLWLAGVSVLVAVILYAMNAPLVSAIELSVGAGLVTVIFVFAIGLAGELTRDLPSLIPRPLAVAVSIIAAGWLGWLLWPAMPAAEPAETASFQTVLWEMRAVDVWVQIALILAGVLGILNLVVDAPAGIEVVQADHAATAEEEVAA
ncbi:MAG: NADH-quinone oxidoreductase subunit J [Chloroflexota bacterium]|jgi:NADH:ubiquinone oxidoreductase subunit 6 (subunit J)|nr:NADH-quinone oxidoreductase subunit J [Chloroflexota bacterium]